MAVMGKRGCEENSGDQVQVLLWMRFSLLEARGRKSLGSHHLDAEYFHHLQNKPSNPCPANHNYPYSFQQGLSYYKSSYLYRHVHLLIWHMFIKMRSNRMLPLCVAFHLAGCSDLVMK